MKILNFDSDKITEMVKLEVDILPLANHWIDDFRKNEGKEIVDSVIKEDDFILAEYYIMSSWDPEINGTIDKLMKLFALAKSNLSSASSNYVENVLTPIMTRINYIMRPTMSLIQCFKRLNSEEDDEERKGTIKIIKDYANQLADAILLLGTDATTNTVLLANLIFRINRKLPSQYISNETELEISYLKDELIQGMTVLFREIKEQVTLNLENIPVAIDFLQEMNKYIVPIMVIVVTSEDGTDLINDLLTNVITVHRIGQVLSSASMKPLTEEDEHRAFTSTIKDLLERLN